MVVLGEIVEVDYDHVNFCLLVISLDLLIEVVKRLPYVSSPGM